MKPLAVLAVLLVMACGRTPTESAGVHKTNLCREVWGWRYAYMADSLGVGRLDSVRVIIAYVC